METPKDFTPPRFTEEEIKAAKEVLEQITESNISELKAIYMAGEINMWVELTQQNE